MRQVTWHPETRYGLITVLHNRKNYLNMEYEWVAAAVGVVTGLIATWIKMTNEVTKIKSRLYSLEKSETKVQQTLDILVEGMNEIKLLLAKKGIR